MIVDSSAVVAILRGEPEAEAFAEILGRSARNRMSAASWLETAVVVDGPRNPRLSQRFDTLLVEASVGVDAVTFEQVQIARQAYRDFGKGSGHPEHLNFGDCFSYAFAKATGEPLLFKGNDFPHTDVLPALFP